MLKKWQFIVLTLAGGACVLLAAGLVVLNQSNAKLQLQLALQQDVINKGSVSAQVGTNLLRDMANVAVSDEAMKDVLKKNGFSLNTNAPEKENKP
jgi:hypothetical protein